jgi:F0F1-type ATP synthase membrane subunit b/b'
MRFLPAWCRSAGEKMNKRSPWLLPAALVVALAVTPPVQGQDPPVQAEPPVEVPGHPHADPGEVVAGAGGVQGASADHHDDHADDEHHEESIWATLSRLANAALLFGGLYYFLRGPIGRYISGRQEQVRADLALASDMRADAARRLEQIEAQLEGLPAELELVKQRGAEEVAAEERRIQERAEVERGRLVAQVQREIAQQTRTARQSLREHAAALAVGVAEARLRETLTGDEHRALADDYIARVGGPS